MGQTESAQLKYKYKWNTRSVPHHHLLELCKGNLPSSVEVCLPARTQVKRFSGSFQCVSMTIFSSLEDVPDDRLPVLLAETLVSRLLRPRDGIHHPPSCYHVGGDPCRWQDLMSFSPRSWSPSESNILKAHSARTVGGVATLYKRRILYIVVMLHHVQMAAFSVANIWKFLILWLGFHCASQPIHGWLINKEWWEQMRKETWLLVKQSKETYSHLRTKKRFKSCLNVREESMFEPERREHVEELLESHQLAGVGREHLTDPLCKRVHLSLR